jgi:DNA polymerase V
MVALIDANNFFVSCERVFNPKLKGKPVIVLSNNDGCTVSRSNEAKALGIKMGVPLFEIRELVRKEKVHVFSSNYTLYGDLSDRMMQIIASTWPEIETYSIDEAFIDLRGYPESMLPDLAARVRSTILQWIGLPVSIGIAPTKVLAKVASKVAKKNGSGVCALMNRPGIEEALKSFPVEDLWGVGRRYSVKLNSYGIITAYQLSRQSAPWVNKIMTVNGLRIHQELNSIPCIPVERFTAKRKAIGSAKGFGITVSDLGELKEALSTYTSTCAAKMRVQNHAASVLTVFLQTNYFNKQEKQYSGFKTISLPTPTSLSPTLIKYALHALKEIFRPGFNYKRVGILLTGFVPDTTIQEDLFDCLIDRSKLTSIQKTIDKINTRYDRNQLWFACQGLNTKRWKMKQEKLSPKFTTSIKEILEVRI